MEKQPVRVLPARAWRTYRGGSLIAALHGEAGEDSHFPEEWLLSTVQARNPGREQIQEGLSMLPDGRTLREYIAADPEGLLGPGRRETGMLMKLIDAAERLKDAPIYVDDSFNPPLAKRNAGTSWAGAAWTASLPAFISASRRA